MQSTEYEGRKTQYPINNVILTRWSPRAFDPHFVMSQAQCMSLFEAARWAPSSGNLQPWRFLYAERGSAAHAKIVQSLTGYNVEWAPKASILIVAVTKKTRVNSTGDIVDNSLWNLLALGQACQNLVLQARSMGLYARQMGGFETKVIAENFSIDTNDWIISNLIAVGSLGDTNFLSPDKREQERPNQRLTLAEIVQKDNFVF